MSTTPCPQCGAVNRPGARFCTTCGAALAAPPPSPSAPSTCPQCGAPLQQKVRFCPACGHLIAAKAQPPGDDKRLVVRWPGGRTEEHPLLRSMVRIGRAPDNDIVLDFLTVRQTYSSHHA